MCIIPARMGNLPIEDGCYLLFLRGGARTIVGYVHVHLIAGVPQLLVQTPSSTAPGCDLLVISADEVERFVQCQGDDAGLVLAALRYEFATDPSDSAAGAAAAAIFFAPPSRR